MAVYTKVTSEEAERFCRQYFPDACLHSLEPIAAGIENTNYFVTLDGCFPQAPVSRCIPAAEAPADGLSPDAGYAGHSPALFGPEQRRQFVLTLFEMGEGVEPVLVDYMLHLERAGLPVPAPLQTTGGSRVGYLHRQAILAPRIEGQVIAEPQATEVAQGARLLARLHLAGKTFAGRLPSRRDRSWIERHASALRFRLPENLALQLEEALNWYRQRLDRFSSLPAGWGHQDLFHDNVLFSASGRLAGVIDFYHACEDLWVLDLAIMINDWCVRTGEVGEYEYDSERLAAAIQSYHHHRPLSEAEWLALPDAMALGAMRFWISRLRTCYEAGYQSRAVRGMPIKDPGRMFAIMQAALHFPAHKFESFVM